MSLFIFRNLWSFRECKYTEQWPKKNLKMGRIMENGFLILDWTKQNKEVFSSRKSHSLKHTLKTL